MLPASFWFPPWNQIAVSLSDPLSLSQIWGSQQALASPRVSWCLGSTRGPTPNPGAGPWPREMRDHWFLETRGCPSETARIPNHTQQLGPSWCFPSLSGGQGRVGLKTGCKFQAARDTEATFQKCALGGEGRGAQLVGTGQRRRHPMPSSHQGAPSAPVSLPPPWGVRGAGWRADSLHPLSRAEHSQMSPPTKCGWPTKQVVLGLKDGSGKGPDNVLGFPDHVWLQGKRCACACMRVCRGFCQPCQTGPWDLKSWTHLQPCLLPYSCYKPKQERELDRLCFDRAERKSSWISKLERELEASQQQWTPPAFWQVSLSPAGGQRREGCFWEAVDFFFFLIFPLGWGQGGLKKEFC